MNGYLPEEEMVVCPYDPVHRIRRYRMHVHLYYCSRQHPEIELEVCPFNNNHRYKKEKEDDHLGNCPDRGTFDLYVQSSDMDRIPVVNVEDNNADKGVENWDDDCHQSYNPLKHVEKLPIRRTLKCASKSEKREFREQEKTRFLKVLAKLNGEYNRNTSPVRNDKLLTADSMRSESENEYCIKNKNAALSNKKPLIISKMTEKNKNAKDDLKVDEFVERLRNTAI